MQITFYAGAADAAGTSSVDLDVASLTAADLVDRLGADSPALSQVLRSCSLLVDGAVVRDPSQLISGTARVDVLPPFAGG